MVWPGLRLPIGYTRSGSAYSLPQTFTAMPMIRPDNAFRPRRAYGWFLIGWLILAGLIIGFTIDTNLDRARDDFLAHASSLSQHATDRLRTNETVVAGFAAMVGLSPTLDRPKVRAYARQMLDRYPQIFMFEVLRKVARPKLSSFERRFRREVDPHFKVRAFGYEAGRRWKPLATKPFYLPIVFMEPVPPDSRKVLGLDVSSNAFFVRSLRESARLNRPIASEPFHLIEGPLAYLIHQPIRGSAGKAAAHGDDRLSDRYAMLVIRADTLLPSDTGQRPGMHVLLYHSAFAPDKLKGRLFEAHGPERGWLARHLFPRLSYRHRMETAGQPFVLELRRQLGWSDLDWPLLATMVAVVLAALAAALGYARTYHSGELARLSQADRLFHMANHDQLTGLANRNLLNDRLAHAISQRTRNSEKVAILFLDVNDFKRINDTAGHESGDAILRAIGERLRGCMREGDTVARYGGDEFVVVLEQVEDIPAVTEVEHKIHEAFAQPFAIAGREFQLGVSIGVALCPDDAADGSGLLAVADNAMYRRKRRRA